MLSTRNIQFKNGKKKSQPKYLDPFTIEHDMAEGSMPLVWHSLLFTGSMHPVFHVSLLKPYQADSYSKPLPPEPEVEEGIPLYKVEKILSTGFVISDIFLRTIHSSKSSMPSLSQCSFRHGHPCWGRYVVVQSPCTKCFLSESDYDSSRFACRDSFRNLCLNCSILCLNCCITHAV